MKRIFALMLVLLCLALPVGALASDIVDYTPDFYTADYANVLDDQTEGFVVLNGHQLDKACGSQIVVVTVDSIGSATDIESYARALFTQWKIGDEVKNNGLLILISVNEGKHCLMPGKGLLDYLNTADLEKMSNEYFLPSAQSGNYSAAVQQLFSACFEKISIAYNARLSINDTLYYQWSQAGQVGTDGARFLSEPLKPAVQETPVIEQNTQAQNSTSSTAPIEEKGGSGIWIIVLIIVILAALIGARKIMSSRTSKAPVKSPAKSSRPASGTAPRPRTTSGTAPRSSAPRTTSGTASRPSAPRTSSGTAARPSAPRSASGTATRPSAPRSASGTATRPRPASTTQNRQAKG